MMTNALHRVLVSAVFALVLATSARAESVSPASQPLSKAEATVTVFAAASLKTALDIIGKEWSAETGHAVTFSYAASSAIAKQIEQGAPATSSRLPISSGWTISQKET